MAFNSAIQWTHCTFNPWIGCAKISAGCRSCYAENETPARVARANNIELWGVNGQRQVTSESYWKQPLLWNRWAGEGVCLACKGKGSVKGQPCPPCDSTGHVTPYRLRVFPSLCDVFEDRPDLIEPRNRLFQLIDRTPNLDWLLLTKRPENIEQLWPFGWYDDQFTWPNIWIGTSVEDQQTADKRIPELLKVPAQVRFLSCEPLLGPVDLKLTVKFFGGSEAVKDIASDLHWVITGGESGPNARECSLDWIHSLTEQCGAAGVPIFVKQLGAKPYYLDDQTKQKVPFEIRDKKGGDIRDFPCHFHRDFPHTNAQ